MVAMECSRQVIARKARGMGSELGRDTSEPPDLPDFPEVSSDEAGFTVRVASIAAPMRPFWMNLVALRGAS
jgi:hypothetical protein